MNKSKHYALRTLASRHFNVPREDVTVEIRKNSAIINVPAGTNLAHHALPKFTKSVRSQQTLDSREIYEVTFSTEKIFSMVYKLD